MQLMKRCVRVALGGDRLWAAAAVYLGLGLVASSMIPEQPKALAHNDGCNVEYQCQTSEVCCLGTCHVP